MEILQSTFVSIIVAQAVVIVYLTVLYRNSLKAPPCEHAWRRDHITDVYEKTFGSRSYCHSIIRCQCTKCGTWKNFKVK